MSLRQEQLQVIQDRYNGTLTDAELQLIAQTFSSTITPSINRLTLHVITKSEAVKIGTTLVMQSSLNAIVSQEEYNLPESHALQGLSFLAEKIFDEKKPASVEQVNQLLNTLFEKFPETTHITEFTDLSLQADLILEGSESENSMIAYTKEKLSLHKKLNTAYLSDAHSAFDRWKKHRRSYSGALCRIIELIDKLIAKYTQARNEIIAFSQIMFRHTFTRKEIIVIDFNNFNATINLLIALDDEHIVSSLCRHIRQNKLDAWMLTQILSHPAFIAFTSSERRIVFKVLTAILNSKQSYTDNHLLTILNKCTHSDFRIVLLQRLNEFYREQPFPPIASLIEWVNLFSNNNAQNMATALEASYILFNNDNAKQEKLLQCSHAHLTKQLNKLKIAMDTYSNTSFFHTRKARAGYLSEFGTRQLLNLNSKDADETQVTMHQTIAELYLHYSTIEKASGIISRTLEKRLIRLLHIPKDDKLTTALTKRESLLYKFYNLFNAGRSCFKHYRDKVKDPVQDIIWQHLPDDIRLLVNHLDVEISQLGQLDQSETSLFNQASISPEKLADIGHKITRSLG